MSYTPALPTTPVTVVFFGSSLPRGSGSTDPMTPAVPSGTTTLPYDVSRLNTGRGTWVAQGFDVADAHSFNYGASGGNLQFFIDHFDQLFGSLFDGLRTGPKVFICWELGNTIQSGVASTFVALKAKCVELNALFVAQGAKLYWMTGPDRGLGANGTNGNLTGWWTDGSYNVQSAYGLVQQQINTELLAVPLTYGYGTIGAAETAGNHVALLQSPASCLNTTYYNAAVTDYTHLSTVGYAYAANPTKTYFDVNDRIFYPIHSGVMVTSRRRRR